MEEIFPFIPVPEALDEEEPPFTVSDLKQWMYCPRLVYYAYCLPDVRPVTFAMQAGSEAGRAEVRREMRRSLRVYGLRAGERAFNVPVRSLRLGLRGKVDLVIQVADGPRPEIIPVDYKDATRTGRHFRLQVAAYGLMLEENSGLPARRGFIYSIPLRRAQEIRLTPRLRRQVEQTAAAMRAMLYGERLPPPTPQRAKCVACEFRRFCNDVV
ncbi:MAG: CRISPR-associated protein Cas4 [Anaerolineae bacterium]|nr:MAG: CRISPR-associated protein Cas4 [Anaerolineae bacterium]